MTGARTIAEVVGRREVAPATVLLELRPQARVPAAPPGSHIDVTVRLPHGPESRSYSVVDLGLDDDLLRIAVRRDSGGRGGSAWMHTLRPAQPVEISRPVDAFPPTPGRGPDVLLAAGIGITPILGLARALRDRGDDYRIVYVGRSRDSMAFLDHLEENHPGRTEVFESRGGRRRPRADQLVATVPETGVLYVCGPMGLLSDIRAAWRRAGRPTAHLRFETFGTSGGHTNQPFRVAIPRHATTVDVPAGTSLLDALEDAGVELMHGCRRGECGLCRVKVLDASGPIDHRDVFLSDRQRAAGTTLCACVSRVAGGSIAIDC